MQLTPAWDGTLGQDLTKSWRGITLTTYISRERRNPYVCVFCTLRHRMDASRIPTRGPGDRAIQSDADAGRWRLQIGERRGAAANIATLPVVAPAGEVPWISPSAAELQAKHVVLRLVDAAARDGTTTQFHIFTVGDPNAFFEFDLFSGSVALSLALAK